MNIPEGFNWTQIQWWCISSSKTTSNLSKFRLHNYDNINRLHELYRSFKGSVRQF